MKNLVIQPLNPIKDIEEISEWSKIYKDDLNFKSIKKYILEDNLYYGLDEVIITNYEIIPIGNNERKFAFSIKDKCEIAGFILCLTHQLQTKNPELILQYFVLNPTYQNKGLGKQIINELITNSNKYLNTKIKSVFARVEKSNIRMIKTLKNFGFNFTNQKDNYLAGTLEILENINE